MNPPSNETLAALLKEHIDDSNKSASRLENYIRDVKESMESHFSKLNGRTKKLETWQTWVIGWTAGLSFAIGSVLYILKNIV